MNADRKRAWDDLEYRFCAFVDQSASVAAARLIQHMPEKAPDDVLERLMDCASDVIAEQFNELVELVVEKLKPVFMAVEGDAENLSGFSPPAPDAAPIPVARAG